MEDLRPASEMFPGGKVPALFARSRSLKEKPRRPSDRLPAGHRAVMIAACRAVEHAWEIARTARVTSSTAL